MRLKIFDNYCDSMSTLYSKYLYSAFDDVKPQWHSYLDGVAITPVTPHPPLLLGHLE